MEDYEKINLKTGDLLLFDFENYSGLGIFSYLIQKNDRVYAIHLKGAHLFD